MILTAEVRYYQSHKRTKVKFGPGLTVITGTSHHGKSALQRAMRWPLLNRPLGFEYKSWFSDDKDITRSAIEFDDGHVVREKSKNKNLYKVSGIDDPLEALGTDLPEEVTRVTRMNEINIQRQHDPYFMLQNTPGQVGRMFNEAVGLQIIDESLTELNKRVTKIYTQLTFREEENTKLSYELDEYEFLDEVAPLLSELEDLLEAKTAKEKKMWHLTRVVEDMQILEMQQGECDRILQHENDWLTVNNLLAHHTLQRNKLLQLEDITDEVWTLQQELEEINEVLQYEDDIQWCIDKLDEAQEKAILMFELQQIVDDLEELELARKGKKQGMAGTSMRYFKRLRLLKKCPTCGTEITDKVCEHLEEVGL
jgi:exonuclease SbcC